MISEDRFFIYLNDYLYPHELKFNHKEKIKNMTKDNCIILAFSGSTFGIVYDLLWWSMGYDLDLPLTIKEEMDLGYIVGVLMFRYGCNPNKVLRVIGRLQPKTLVKIKDSAVLNEVLEIPNLGITTLASLVEARFNQHGCFSMTICPGA